MQHGLGCNGVPQKYETHRHRTGVREGIQFFDVGHKNMSEDDKLFNFTSGLQTWAQAELRRQGVRDLPSAIAAAEGLVDFKMAPSSTEKKKEKSKEHWKDKKKEKSG